MRPLFVLFLIFITSEANEKHLENLKKPWTGDEVRYKDRNNDPDPYKHVADGEATRYQQPEDQGKVFLSEADYLRNMGKFQPPRDGLAGPRDSIMLDKETNDPDRTENREIPAKVKNSDIEKGLWIDFSRNLARSITRMSDPRSTFEQKKPQAAEMKRNPTLAADARRNPNLRAGYQPARFSQKSFDLERKRNEFRKNWTSCAEFGRNAEFHPKDVVNINWVPFYAWSTERQRRIVSKIHYFTFPSVKVVKRYKQELGPHINKTLDWGAPKLLMKCGTEMLLIAVDRKGEFEAIPYNELPKDLIQTKYLVHIPLDSCSDYALWGRQNIVEFLLGFSELVKKEIKLMIPLVNLRLKTVGPYLALMFCELQLTTIMAHAGREPTELEDMRTQAATLKFRGRGYPLARDMFHEQESMKSEQERRMREKEKFVDVEHRYIV